MKSSINENGRKEPAHETISFTYSDSNGAWVISRQSNKMDSWIESKTSSTNKVGLFDDKGLIEVEKSTALIWTDSCICTHMYGGQRVEFL